MEIQEYLNDNYEDYLVLCTKGNQLTVMTSPKLTFPDSLMMMSTALLNNMQKTADNSNVPNIKEELYDMVNTAASNILQLFAPEIEMRPDLTAQAILAAENAILDDLPQD